jgi:hypothetical protein
MTEKKREKAEVPPGIENQRRENKNGFSGPRISRYGVIEQQRRRKQDESKLLRLKEH